MTYRFKRALSGLAALGLAATLVSVAAGPADATPGAQPDPILTPLPVETAATPFTFSVPGNAFCDGTTAGGWRVHSFIVNENVDPSTLDFSVSGFPSGWVGGDFDSNPDGTIAAPLFKGAAAGVNIQPANSPAGQISPSALAGFSFSSSSWDLAAGNYKIGFACVDGTTAVQQWWTNTVTIFPGSPAFMKAASDAIDVGFCTDLKGLGTLKSTTINPGDGKPYGLSDNDNQDVAISLKGVDPLVAKPPTGTANVGSCTYAPGLSTPDGGKPIVKGYNGTKVIDKWTAKLTSPEADCNPADGADLTEWPLNGTFSFTYRTDLRKQSVAVIVDGFTSDIMSFHGLVTKGVAAGADVSGSLYFDPVIKDKLQTTASPYFGYSLDVSGACADSLTSADVRTVLVGDGPSPALGLPASGISFSIGQP